MADQGEHHKKSWILHHILDRMIGSREIVALRRKMILVQEYVKNSEMSSMLVFETGSMSEGFVMKGSDRDAMGIYPNIEVICPNQNTSFPSDNRNMTIFVMRNDDCRSCYVTLEVVKLERSTSVTTEYLVPVQDKLFISSEIYKQLIKDEFNAQYPMDVEIHGPASSVKNKQSNFGIDTDFAISFRCKCWPPKANEWLSRTRQHGWPGEVLVNNISQSGCHVVPIGDKTSPNTSLQWRISFATAERKLIHSLSHEQFLVYGLLKYFLKQISGILIEIGVDEDILSSYIMKTVIFFAVESTPHSLWKEQNTFPCFILCLDILISWVNAGYCPNYFIVSNNMFKGKLHGGNQEKLLRFLMEMHVMKWMCLSVGTFIQPSIGVRIQRVFNGEWKDILLAPNSTEFECDLAIFRNIFASKIVQYSRSLALLSKSQSDIDEFISYYLTVKSLSLLGTETFEEQNAARGNKEKYKSLRKCKIFMTPIASVCTSPGLMVLATYYYRTGNYTKALTACGNMLSSFKWCPRRASSKDNETYLQLYCGRGYTLLHKCQESIASNLFVNDKLSTFYPSKLRQHFTTNRYCAYIPPLPYAVFLSFLCYHEIGDRKRRDAALTQLRMVKYDEHQGGSEFWIVHNLLGICYELVGDTRRAIREYRESLSGGKILQQFNPARENITRLLHSQGEAL